MNQDGVPGSEHRARRNTRPGPSAWAGLLLGLAVAILAWGVSRPIEPRRVGIEPSRPDGVNRGRVPHDAECARCHARIVESYRRHPMGRSLATIEAWLAAGATAMASPASFEAQGLDYTFETKGGRVVHREARRDSAGRVIAENQAEILYVLGSGKQALSFLIDRDGFLFESPITYYVQERRWGLSPGYEKRNRHLHRPILADCLFCHTNRVERASGAVNQFVRPIFRGHAIGCERCHGPTERHLARPVASDGATIVNPANLEPSLRDAVCEHVKAPVWMRISLGGQ